MGVFISNLIRFIAIIIFQVAVLNNVQLNGYINPYVYIMFIMFLPVEIPKWTMLSLSFLLGITIDIFCNTPGIHASASVFVAFLKPSILSFISVRDGYEAGITTSIKTLGFGWFLKYTFYMTITHHIFLFFVEVFTFHNFYNTIFRIVLSSLFTILLIVVIHAASANKNLD